jgi:hypothetical protein
MDRGMFRSPETIFPPVLNTGPMINHARGVDYASSNSSFVISAAGGGHTAEAVANCQYSTNRSTDWNLLPNQPGGDGIVTTAMEIAATPLNHVVILNYNGGIFYTKDNGATPWLACGGLNPAGGWRSFNVDHRRNNIIADRVNIGTFYAYCDKGDGTSQIMGFYKSTDGGATWALYASGVYHLGYTPPQGNDDYAYEMQMRSIEGQAGNFYCSTGRFMPARGMPFYEMQDNGTTLVRRRVIGVDTPHCWGYGKAKPGNTYPSIYIWARVAAAQDTAGIGGWGVWRSDDHAQMWTRGGAYPGDSLDAVGITGDRVYGKCVVSFYGTGFPVYN